MADDQQDGLTELEAKMLKGIEREWERWQTTTGPLPMALVSLMRVAHDAILKRVAKGLPDPNMVKDPYQALLRVKKIEAGLLELIRAQERNVQ
jgi:hypothetical protein